MYGPGPGGHGPGGPGCGPHGGPGCGAPHGGPPPHGGGFGIHIGF